jgi:glycosyltransferase involved in cell wall biosynthesis
MKPKLLVTTSTFPRWADDTDPPFVFELAKRLAGDFDIIIHAPHYPQARTSEVIEGIAVHRFRYCPGAFEKLAGSQGILPTLKRNKTYYLLVPFFLAAQFFSLVFLVRRIRPTLIHAHWIIPQGLAAVIMNRLFGIPVVVTAHGGDVFGLQHPFFLKIKQFVLSRATMVTAVSSALRTIILRDNPGIDVAVIPMGVDAQVFMPGKTEVDIRKHNDIGGKLILYVGRLSEKKWGALPD